MKASSAGPRSLNKLPSYEINSDGALAEWSWPGLKDNYDHRHSSQMLGVWPFREITPESDLTMFNAALVTLAKKDQYNYENAGHGLLHAALNAANLKNAQSLTNHVLTLTSQGYYYSGLASSHYTRTQRLLHGHRQRDAGGADGDARLLQPRDRGALARAA